MIDFKNTVNELKELVVGSLNSFDAENTNVKWSNFALYACPWSGWISSCFDTEPNSNKVVSECEENGSAWYGEDETGRYNSNCPDFQYFEWRSIELPHWEEEYYEAVPLHIRDLSGKDHYIDGDNEKINGLAFDYMRTILLSEIKSQKAGNAEFMNGKWRVGIQLLDSAFVEFWRNEKIGI